MLVWFALYLGVGHPCYICSLCFHICFHDFYFQTRNLCSKTECHLLRMKDEVFTTTCRALSNLPPPSPGPHPPPPSLQSPPLREHWSLGTSLNFISISCIWNVLSPKKNYVTCFLLSFSFSPFFQSLFSLSWTWYHLFLLQFFFFLPLATN